MKFDPVSIDELRKRKREFSERLAADREATPRTSTDGRSLRAGSRSEQLNLRVTKEFKSALQREAQATGMTMAEVMEAAWDAYRTLRDAPSDSAKARTGTKTGATRKKSS
ncbi:MAG: hypothetical protein GC150_17665 [Rhizobiales bacterium]|nr:hypothetical protein [Hyphomicrobiales bacterium]